VRDFRLLWIGATISLFGDQFYLVALPWLVLQLTGSSLALGTILMAAAIPRAVFMLMGGAMSDRLSARKILIATAAARTVLVAAVGTLAWWHVISLPDLYVLAFAFGLADAFSYPAHQTLVPSLVAPEQLPAANAMVQASAQASTIAGPAPAGIVVKHWGIAQAFFIDAVSFLFIIAALWRLPEKSAVRGTQPRENVWRSIIGGLRYVAHDPAIRALTLISAAINLGITGPLTVGMATTAKLRMGSPAAFGTMVSALSAGSLAGMLLAGAVRRPRALGIVLVALSAFLGGCMLGLGLLHGLLVIAVFLATMGLGSGFVQIHLIAWFQARVERALLGRVTSVLIFGAVGLVPISYALAGVLAQISLELMFFSGGALVLVVALIAATSRGLRSM
jgi:MFS family permease